MINEAVYSNKIGTVRSIRLLQRVAGRATSSGCAALIAIFSTVIIMGEQTNDYSIKFND